MVPSNDKDRVIQNAQDAVSELRDNISRIPSSIDVILARNAGPAEHLRVALTQVGLTYRTVDEAIQRFFIASMRHGPIDPQPFVEWEGGSLENEIHNGLGHCTLIGIHYYTEPDGLRHWIKDELNTQELQQADEVFSRLSEADADLFQELGKIGKVLTEESGAVVKMLIAGQEDAARSRVGDVHRRLEPLRKQLSKAKQELQQRGRSVGYAEPM
jgi:hypothetical protein